MPKTIALGYFLTGPSAAGTKDSNADYIMSVGLQELLTALLGIYSAAITQQCRVPSKFTGNFRQALTRPSPGKLHQFLLWMSSHETSPGVKKLSQYLQQAETGGASWLKEMGELRNRWAHPKDETSQQILARVDELLAETPDYASLGQIEVSDKGEVRWTSDGVSHPLYPFFWSEGKQIRVFTEFAPPNRLLCHKTDTPTQAQFTAVWKKLRLLDPALEAPTVDEFHVRANRMASSYDAEAPWWIAKAFVPGPAAILVLAGLLDGVLGHIDVCWPRATGIEFTLSEETDPMRSLAENLGFARPPSREELVSFTETEHRLCLGLRTSEMNSWRFLQLLYWVADLHASGTVGNLRVFIEREQEQLARDHETLWDRLPDDLGKTLRSPPRTSAAILPDFLWTDKRKRFLGLF